MYARPHVDTRVRTHKHTHIFLYTHTQHIHIPQKRPPAPKSTEHKERTHPNICPPRGQRMPAYIYKCIKTHAHIYMCAREAPLKNTILKPIHMCDFWIFIFLLTFFGNGGTKILENIHVIFLFSRFVWFFLHFVAYNPQTKKNLGPIRPR